MSKNLSGVDILTDNAGTVIYNGQITTKQITTNALTTNGDINLTGSIINGSNSITFSESTLYTNIPQNFFINGTGLIQYQGINYNIGQVLSAFVGGGTVSPYPSITYSSSLNITYFTGGMSFPSSSISSSSINNSDFATISTTQTLSNKEFSGTTVFSSIQLNSALIVNSGGTTISNSQLALIPSISTIQTDVNNLKVKTTNQSFSGTTTTWTGSVSFPNNSISSASINNSTRFIENTGNQTVGGQKTFNSILIMNNNFRMDTGSLVLNNNTLTIPNSTLQKLQFISTISSDIQTQTTNNSTNITTNTNNITTNTNNITTNTNNITTNTNSINSINTKLTDVSYTTGSTTIGNTLNLTNLNFTDKLNTFLKLDVDNVFTQCASLSSNCQNQINDAVSKASAAKDKADSADTKAVNADNKASSALALAGVANGAAVAAAGIATGAAATAAGAVSVNTTQQTEIDDLQADVITLQAKTSQISYSPTTLRTTIGQTTYLLQVEIAELISGINQTSQDQITLAGLLRCNNRVEVNNTLELVNNNSIIVEGIINQDNANPPNAGVNQFQAPSNFNGNCIFTNTSTTINATTTQIGVNAVSTLNCNATAIFGGDISMGSTKNLTLKNIVPILLNDIYFGGEAGVYLNDDVVFNMKIEANRPVQINNTLQVGTTINRNTLNSYTTTTVLDANTGMTLTTPTIGITSPLITLGQGDATSITLNSSGVYIGQLLGSNYLYGTTYVQNLYSASGILGMAGQVFQQF
jgi:hypothetical protein